jgi:hypothetical protein
MKKPNKRRAIREKCLECSGDSPKEVTLCHLFDCPIWPFRTGSFITSSLYRTRIDKTFAKYPDEVAALAEMEITKDDFLRLHSPSADTLPNLPRDVE